MTNSNIRIKDPSDFEKVVALSFQRKGYKIVMPPTNTKGYDIELQKDGECIAVQVKNHKAKCNIAQIQKFQDFLDNSLGSKFTQGWFISSSGYFKPVSTLVNAEQPENFRNIYSR